MNSALLVAETEVYLLVILISIMFFSHLAFLAESRFRSIKKQNI